MNASKHNAGSAAVQGRHENAGRPGGAKPRSRRKRSKGPRRLLWTLLAVVVVALLAGAFYFLPLFMTKAGDTALVRVPKGATEEQVRDSVAKYFGDDYAARTLRAMRFVKSGESAGRHGAWLITDGMSPFDAARTLERRGQASLTVSLNSCRTPADVASLFASKLEFTDQEMLDALSQGDTPELALCFFLEDNYDFYWTATPQEVLDKMHDNYRDYWTAERLAKAEALGLSAEEVVILASIVDAETNSDDEKGTIAQLYLNRLHKGMRLQSDPTVKYATGDFAAKRVGGEMLKVDSPYNTYKYEGLPPGPIRLTSAATLDAILASRPNDYLYMCADESLEGTHNFAATYEEHLRNRDRYVDELNRRGISLNQEAPEAE